MFFVLGEVQESASSGLMPIMNVYLHAPCFNLSENNSLPVSGYQRQDECILMKIFNTKKKKKVAFLPQNNT